MTDFDVIRELYDDFNLDPHDHPYSSSRKYNKTYSKDRIAFNEFCQEFFLNPKNDLCLDRNKYGMVKCIQHSENSYYDPPLCTSAIWYFEKFDFYLHVEYYFDSWGECEQSIYTLKRVFPKQITVYVEESEL